MMTAILRSALAAMPLVFAAIPARAETIELLHFWEHSAERAALKVFQDSFEAQGGRWFGTSRDNEIELKSYALERINAGFAPAAVQWHGGPEIQRLMEMEISTSLEEVLGADAALPLLAVVAEALQVRGETGALPVGLHGENWVWRNLDIYRALDLPAPRDWAHFLEQAALIRAAGYRPLAIGHKPWERRVLFTSILTDIGGAGLYRRLIDSKLDRAHDLPLIERAFELMLRLRDEATEAAHAHGSWSRSTLDVIEGRAALQVMGDWAKGEFLNAGKLPGQDFDCMPGLGNPGVMAIVLDVFILPRTSNDETRVAQRQLVEIVLAPDNQRRFATAKGALPVVAGVDSEEFDQCTRTALDIISAPGGGVRSFSLALTQDRIARIQGAIQDAWELPEITPASAALSLLKECELAMQ